MIDHLKITVKKREIGFGKFGFLILEIKIKCILFVLGIIFILCKIIF